MSNSDVSGCIIPLLFLGVIGYCTYVAYHSKRSIFGSHVVELKCEGPISENKDCNRIAYVGAETEIIANPSTGSVYTKVINPDDKYRVSVGGFFLSDCLVADANNWECGKGDDKTGMENGKWYSQYHPAAAPEFSYDFSSITGLDYWLYLIGVYHPPKTQVAP
jgi:hypothetical protein